MRIVAASEIHDLAPMPRLIEQLREAFRSRISVTPRQIARVPGGSGERLFVYMPAFSSTGHAVVKLSTSFPDNREENLPAIQGIVVIFSDRGTPVMVVDAMVLTRLRTGAASALASTYLSRLESTHLVIVGTGPLAPYLALGHCSVRPIRRVSVFGRHKERAVITAASIRSLLATDVKVQAVTSLEEATLAADIVSCATSSTEPVLAGKWLRPGAFVDLVGSFSPTKREADDDTVARSRIFVDTREGALSEAGDLLIPLQRGVIDQTRIEGDLADLVCERVGGRQNDQEIILFKSVGTAIEDFAAAQMIAAAVREKQGPELSW